MFFFGKTDIGLRRGSNQDSFFAGGLYRNAALCVVCDGMGGANGGNIASKLAVDVFEKTMITALAKLVPTGAAAEKTELNPSAADFGILLREAAEAANSVVYARANANSELRGMGTTLVAALVINKKLFAINIGDSRLYIATEKSASQGTITQFTRDHSYVQYLVDIGKLTPEEAIGNPIRNIITRSVGNEPEVEGDIYTADLSDYGHGYLLLCSDGLTNFMTVEQISAVLFDGISYDETKPEEILRNKATQLVDGANENGGGDNITALLLRF
jgi:Serine/threonine protein phosphatase